MLSRRQELWFFVLAGCLHVAAYSFLRWTVRIPARTSSLPVASEVAFDITLDGEPGAGAARVPADGVELDARDVAPRRMARIEGRRGSYESVPEGISPEASDAATDGEPDADATSEAEASNRPINLGIGPDGWKRWVTAAEGGERTPRAARPRARRTDFRCSRSAREHDRRAQEGLEEHDRSLGLGPSGRVLPAFHNAAHQTVAPQRRHARFDVTVLQRARSK